jgi:hypothetical protein
MLRNDGWAVNHKRMERIWRRESLKVPKSSPRWITLTPEIIARLRKPIKRSYKKRSTSR